jgi:hypothetical protein
MTLNYQMIVEKYQNQMKRLAIPTRLWNCLSTWQKTSHIVKRLMCFKKHKQKIKNKNFNMLILKFNHFIYNCIDCPNVCYYLELGSAITSYLGILLLTKVH